MARLDQKLALGIDFALFDADLRRVADRIESAGKAASAKVSGAAGDLAAGKLDPGEIRAAVADVGNRLATGMADGVRRSSSLMLGFAARVNKMLDKLVGSAVTMFRRIDDSMKFPLFYAFLRGASVRLMSFATASKKTATEIGVDIATGLDGTVQQVFLVAKSLIDRLAAEIKTALAAAVRQVGEEFAKVVGNVGRAEAGVGDLLKTTQAVARAAPRFPQFAPTTPGLGTMPPRGAVPGTGRRLGFNAGLATQEVPKIAGALGRADNPIGDILQGLKAVKIALVEAARGGAAITSVFVAGAGGILRFRNFLGKLGDVGKASYRKLFESHGLFVGAVLGSIKAVGTLTRVMVRLVSLGTLGKPRSEVEKLGLAARTSGAQVTAMTGKVRNLGREILAAFGVIGVIYKTVTFLKDGVVAASDLNEAVSRSEVVFGASFGAVEAQAKAMTKAFGISHKAQLDVASGFGAMIQGAGFTEKASADLSNQLTKMAADLSSSVNIPFEEAGAAIRSALAGEAEPLRRFGVNVLETKVQAQGLAMGLGRVARSGKTLKTELSDQDKMLARTSLIMQGLSYAQGDLERTSESAANQFRKAGGGVEEFGIRIGQLLLPAITTGTQAFNEFMAVVLDFAEASAPVLQGWAENVKAVFDGVGLIVRNRGAFWEIAQLKVGEFVENAMRWIGVLPENFGRITAWLGRNWYNLLTDMLSAAQAIFTNLITNAANLGTAIWNAITGQPWEFAWTPLLDGFKATTEKFPELIKPNLISVADEVARITDEIGRKEAERAAAIGKKPAAKKPPGPAMADAKAGEYKLPSAVEINSKEAASIIAKNMNPGRESAQVRATRGVQSAVERVREAIQKNPPIKLGIV